MTATMLSAGIAPGAVRAFLMPGKLLASDQGQVIATIVGSCVSVCLFDVAAGIGGMNHFLLPHRIGVEDTSPRYGSSAIPLLLDALLRLGASQRRLEARVFGGGAVMREVWSENHLGLRNAEFALAFLNDAGIPVGSSDVGGARGRKIVFHTDSGAAFVKLI